jgi:antibiotic biosynthesis monooxygenase (ABM) superfamily enzyme
MAAVLLTVRATITADAEEAFNRWYEDEHCPQLLRYKGAVSARRYRKILGDDKYQYMAMYEFESEATFEAFQKSEHFAELIAEYDRSFGDVSTRERAAYVQVWP